MGAFAKFVERDGQLFRLDTRIYLRHDARPTPEDECMAAVVAKNPGSARPTALRKLAPLTLAGDKLIPYVYNRFREAYTRVGEPLPNDRYIRVCNLFYLCNKNLQNALAALDRVEKPWSCDREGNMPPLVWFAWGNPDDRLALFKERFLKRPIEYPFFYDSETSKIARRVPTLQCKAHHTQGLEAAPIVAQLVRHLRRARAR